MIDYSTWDHLLKEYVNADGQVDYQRWQREAQPELKQWLHSLTDTKLQQLTDQEQFTLLINLYNALVIDQILQRYPLKSILPRFLGIPNWLSFLRFFSRSIYTLGEHSLSLNEIEHQMLRKQWQDPRIHFALVCAAQGCPCLRNEAYQPTPIQEQLHTDAERFINNPDKLRYDPERRLLQCSKIFKWYEPDFLQVSSSLPHYVSQYLSFTLPEDLSIEYLPYDWHLNEQ